MKTKDHEAEITDDSFSDAFWKTYGAMVAEFYRPLSVKDGISEKSIAEAERKLGIKLPRLLRDLYLRTGKRNDLHRSHNRLLLPDQLRLIDTKLVAYVENQNVVFWAVDRNDSNYDNPSVYRTINPDLPSWEIDHRYLSDFLLTMLYWQGVNGGMKYVGVGVIDRDVMLKVETFWDVVQLDLKRWDGMQVFSRKGQILCITNSGSERTLHAGARTKSDFLSIDSRLDIDWDYCTLDDD